MIVFAGGIGENDDRVREAICKKFGYLGLEFDSEKNKGLRSKEAIISKPNSKVKVLVVPTNEELVIAQETVKVINNIKELLKAE